MADRARRTDRFATIASNVCACLSGAAIALVAVNYLLERTIKVEPPPHTIVLEAPETPLLSPLQATRLSTRHPAQTGSAAPVIPALTKPVRLASERDDELDRSKHEVADRTGAVSPWSVHLVADWSREKAIARYTEIQRRFHNVLTDVSPIVMRVENHAMGTAERYAVRIGQPDRSNADGLCKRLVDAGGACVVYRASMR